MTPTKHAVLNGTPQIQPFAQIMSQSAQNADHVGQKHVLMLGLEIHRVVTASSNVFLAVLLQTGCMTVTVIV